MMTKFTRVVLLLSSLSAGLATAADRFEINNGDRVLFMGDTLFEREGRYGFFETQMRTEFAKQKFSVRNLAFSGDSPLGASRASFDPVTKGVSRIQEQLALVKPTVAFLGYGMASSLEELTQINNDSALNPDIARYGTNHNATAFKADLGQLMDIIVAASPEQKVRFVLIAPLSHKDMRKQKPGSPDPALHNKLLGEYAKAIEALAQERGATLIRADYSRAAALPVTDNGIHPNEYGWSMLVSRLAEQLGWQNTAPISSGRLTALRSAIQKKNEQFFHRWRPANETYLLGFRKGEQGRNAVEIPQFDPIVDKAEDEIFALQGSGGNATVSPAAPMKLGDFPPQAQPEFKLDDGVEISLFAENPLLEKPTQMNWDSQGRLWIASSGIYPQIAPGGEATDKILILEDTDHDGKADKSTVFVDELLMPTGVVPDGRGGCYVGASTELLHFSEPDKNGHATKKEIVLSAFGTEDTHHIVHTLHWGPDGRLYFHQSIYIHSHLETPWGLIRANAGTVFALDTKTDRVEVQAKGLWNSWGQQENRVGQTFLTDGAGGDGVSWAFPGAVFKPSEGARNTTHSISPGSYPKFCGLELINSPAFPDEWQDCAITCDFRAHRIVRFGFTDLTQGDKPMSGYVTKEMPDVLRTSDVSFRPIDVRIGPDGALYVADWSNPVINHGEVDFRDPRRDHHHGRIWRITFKGRETLKWASLAGKKASELQELLTSKNRWDREQARREIYLSGKTPDAAKDESSALIAMRASKPTELAKLVGDANPRTRLEAIRALARIPTAQSASLVLDAAVASQKSETAKGDDFLNFATWQAVNDLAKPWADAVLAGMWKSEGHSEQFDFAMRAINPSVAAPVAQSVLMGKEITTTDQIDLIKRNGSPANLRKLFETAMSGKLGALQKQGLNALIEAAQSRDAKPDGDLSAVSKLFDENDRDLRAAGARLSGLWHLTANAQRIAELAGDANDEGIRNAGFESFRYLGFQQTVNELKKLAAPDRPLIVRRGAIAVQAMHDLPSALANIGPVIGAITSEGEALDTWRGILKSGKTVDALAKNPPKGLPPVALAAAIRAARELGRPGKPLLTVLEPMAGKVVVSQNMKGEIAGIVGAVEKGGDPSQGEFVYIRIGCAACHSIGGAGGKLAPDMTSLGASAPMDYIAESVLDPAAKVKEGYHAFAFTMKDGSRVTGIPTRETATEQFIRPGPGPEIPLAKANITGRENVGSLMPPGLVNGLDFVEKRSLFAFLGQLGKVGSFDASQGNVARVWWLFPTAEAAGKNEGGLPVYPLIDGRLPRELLEVPASGFKNGLFAAARFSVATATSKPLSVKGAQSVWLDGKAATPSIASGIAAGSHVIVVQLDPAKLPDVLSAQCNDARFIGD